MKICVIGAGAIGGLMGAKLALAGNEVSVADQGAHLEAIRKNGLKLIWEDGSEHVAKVAAATDDVTTLGKQDLIILALKAHYLEQVARQLDAVVGPETMIVTVQNGIPWWYFHKLKGPYEGKRLDSLDPDGTLGKYVDSDKIIGCVVYP
ncbi:MAG: 2-dehydropantoate 2-reductase N-terminal domain-containing protein, partial [Rhodospirillaceae bacterium]